MVSSNDHSTPQQPLNIGEPDLQINRPLQIGPILPLNIRKLPHPNPVPFLAFLKGHDETLIPMCSLVDPRHVKPLWRWHRHQHIPPRCSLWCSVHHVRDIDFSRVFRLVTPYGCSVFAQERIAFELVDIVVVRVVLEEELSLDGDGGLDGVLEGFICSLYNEYV